MIALKLFLLFINILGLFNPTDVNFSDYIGLPNFALQPAPPNNPDPVDLNAGGGGGGNNQADCASPDACLGSSFSSIVAAWGTVGYYTLADIMSQVSAMDKIPILLYICGAIGALIGVAIGAPPRAYIWFMVGPAIYHILMYTTQEVQGVRWEVAGVPQNQKMVWRDAEVGVANVALVKQLNLNPTKDAPPQFQPEQVRAPSFILYWDWVLSDQVQQLINWTGVYSNTPEGSSKSNRFKPRNGTSSVPGATGGSAGSQPGEGPWYIMSNLKWAMLENITGATLKSPDVRDQFITFLSSECGSEFKRNLDQGSYVAASQNRGVTLPVTVIGDNNSSAQQAVGGFAAVSLQATSYTAMKNGLTRISIDPPRSLKRVLSISQETSQRQGMFLNFNPDVNKFATGGATNNELLAKLTSLTCMEFLDVIIDEFRWEAGHTYWQVLRAAPGGLVQQDVVRTLFYGWDIRASEGADYDSDADLMTFLRNLILAHIFKNELAMAPAIADVRQASSQQGKQYVDTYAEKMGAKSKYGEIYQWAVLLPHIQGVLYYILIIGFPFAVMVIVLPGQWKILLTWLSFFAWVKLWDLGFAMVHVIERSVWAMMGNHSSFARVANMVDSMKQHSVIGVSCPNAAANTSSNWMTTQCAVPDVCNVDQGGSTDDVPCNKPGTSSTDDKQLKTLDRALLIGAGSDLGQQNAYYLYIMAALYFAVPAVTGQAVLGAKAGAAGFVNNMIGGVAGEAGKMYASGYAGIATAAAAANSAAVGQAAYARTMRMADSAANRRLSLQNRALGNELQAQMYDMEGKRLDALASNKQNLATSLNYANAAPKLILQHAGGLPSGRDANDQVGKVNNAPKLPAGQKPGGIGPENEPARGRATGDWKIDMYQARLANNESAYYNAALKANSYARTKGMEYAFDSARESSLGKLNNTYGARLGQQAEYEARMAEFEDKTRFANDASGFLAGLGLSAGQLQPMQKPAEFEGMGMAGHLGSKIKAGLDYADTANPSGHFATQVDPWATRGKEHAAETVSAAWGSKLGSSFDGKTSPSAEVMMAAANKGGIPGALAVTFPHVYGNSGPTVDGSVISSLPNSIRQDGFSWNTLKTAGGIAFGNNGVFGGTHAAPLPQPLTQPNGTPFKGYQADQAAEPIRNPVAPAVNRAIEPQRPPSIRIRDRNPIPDGKKP